MFRFSSTPMRVAAVAAAGSALALTVATGTASAAAQQPHAPAQTCAVGHFCAYSDINFTGKVLDLYKCEDHGLPFGGTGSWINNQTGGAQVQFKSGDGKVRWVSPPPYSYDRNADWTWVYWVRPC
jgi:hypothetical protein